MKFSLSRLPTYALWPEAEPLGLLTDAESSQYSVREIPNSSWDLTYDNHSALRIEYFSSILRFAWKGPDRSQPAS